MKIEQIGDWTLEDRLAMGGRPLVVMFVVSDGLRKQVLRAEFRRVADEHQDARFYELDLLENPSATRKYSIVKPPMVLVFVDGIEVARHSGGRIAAMVDRVLGPDHEDEADPSEGWKEG